MKNLEILKKITKAIEDNSTINRCNLQTEMDDEGNLIIRGKTRSYFQKQIAIHVFQKFILENNLTGRVEVAVH